ncbi:hypothetical protein SDC9_177933 [bioreactor metagenome]|uniref:Uncharacterized protein n=1 Tax=bioreactor metagenome TaxID=1076179 RepID=A0A645GWP2_9ZZZZ
MREATVHLAVVSLERLDGGMQRFGGRCLPVRQATLDEDGHALADKAVHLGLAARGGTDLGEHQPAAFGQIGNSVEQGPVEVEGDGLEMHGGHPVIHKVSREYIASNASHR